MDDRCKEEDYDTKFDTDWYLKTHYSADSFALREGSSMQRMCEMFSKMEPSEDGKLLEFGSGPSVHTAGVASRVFKNITMAEYGKPNRESIEKWLNKEKDAFDWTPFLSHIADYEQTSVEVIESRTRSAIKEVIACDANNEDVLPTPNEGPFDFILSTFCLESACTDLTKYQAGMKNLCKVLKPGGKLSIHGELDGSAYYILDKVKFFHLVVTEQDVKQALTNAGMKLESFDCQYIDRVPGYNYPKCFYFLVASKEA